MKIIVGETFSVQLTGSYLFADSAPPPYVASSYRPASVGPVGPPPPFSSSSTDGGKNAPHYVPVAEDGARPSKKFANSAITAQDAKGRDYVLVVDCSGSMLTGQVRWGLQLICFQ